MTSRVYLATLLLALGACATSPTSDLNAFARHSANNSFELLDRGVDPPATLMLPLAHDRQTQGPSCGAHVLASVINYWMGAGAVTGDALYRDVPPAAPDGYSMSELLSLARQHGLMASGVRLTEADIVRELESGRPVLVPVRIPAVYIQDWTLPGANAPLVGVPAQIVTTRVGRLSEWTGLSMVNHYVLIAGYEGETFVALEPIMGFRTISFDRLRRYRQPFNSAAIVFSAPGPARAATPDSPQG